MTELQMGLIGIGALAVVGVLAYNRWLEVRQRKLVESMLQETPPDVLLDDREPELPGFAVRRRVEPDDQAKESVISRAFENPPPTEESVTAGERVEPVLRIEPELEAMARDVSSESPRRTLSMADFVSESIDASEPKARESSAILEEDAAETQSILSPRVDFIASIATIEPVSAQRIVEATKDALARVKKPVRWIGYDGASGEWQPISGQQKGKYQRIRAGLQLVDRRGPVSENELSIFATLIQDLAEQLTGIASFPSRPNVLETAVELDRFCASVDIQIGINVISQGQVFAGTKLRSLAEADGMTIDEDGHFVRRDDDGNVLYVLQNQEGWSFSAETMRTMSTHGLTFLFDVPCVARGEHVFNQMVERARRFADVLRGALVDDNRQPLVEAQYARIRQEFVTKPQAAMEAAGLPAGGSLALRLFN
jgi:FtsZ-interacting cell division protein ZipA